MQTDKQSLVECFKACLEKFTTQPVSDIIDDATINTLFYKSNKEGLIRKPKVLESFDDSIFWYMNIISDSFVRCYNTQDGIDIKRVTNDIQSQLFYELDQFMGGLELDWITAISGEPYESKKAEQMNMLLLPYGLTADHLKETNGVILFFEKQRIEVNAKNIHAIRKQLNMAQDGCLIVACEDGYMSRLSIGIGTKELLQQYPYISFEGHLQWSFHIPPIQSANDDTPYKQGNSCRVRYKNGQLFLPLVDPIQKYKERIKNIFANTISDNVMQAVVNLARSQPKGTTIVLTTKDIAENECKRLCKQYNRGYALHKPCSITDPSDVSFQNLIQKLTAIDGAILMDLDGFFWGAGVILDGKAVTEGDMARGARYNSAPNYIYSSIQEKYYNRQDRISIAVIVASEDGMLNILPIK